MPRKGPKKSSGNLPANSNPQGQNSQRSVAVRGEHFSGPLPPPSILEKYEAIYPGAAQLIIDSYIAQSEHRQELEKQVIRAGARDSLIGLILAFILGLVAIVGAFYCVIMGHDWAGGVLGGTGLSSLVGTFIYGSRQKRAERESKEKTVSKVRGSMA